MLVGLRRVLLQPFGRRFPSSPVKWIPPIFLAASAWNFRLGSLILPTLYTLHFPDEEKQAFRILASHKIIPQNLAKTLSAMAGMRNILVHEYLDVDHDRLYSVMKKQLVDFEKLINIVLTLV